MFVTAVRRLRLNTWALGSRREAIRRDAAALPPLNFGGSACRLAKRLLADARCAPAGGHQGRPTRGRCGGHSPHGSCCFFLFTTGMGSKSIPRITFVPADVRSSMIAPMGMEEFIR